MAFATVPPANWVHTWLVAFYTWLKFICTWVISGSKYSFVDFVSTFALPANTYSNGTSGLGATLTGNAHGALPAIDGTVPAVGQVLLLTNESNGSHNGPYVVTTLGSASAYYVLTRLSGFDVSASILPNTQFLVRSGALHGGHVWEFLGTPLPTVGTTALPFAGTVKRSLFRGAIPSARVAFSANPANADTLVIGGFTIKFLTTLVAANTYAQVKRGSDAATTLASLLNYINGVADITTVEATTPPTFTLFADAPTSTSLRIQTAVARGSKPVPAVSGTLALTASITAGASTWSPTNLNTTGKRDTDQSNASSGPITISTGLITAGTLYVEFPFTPTGFLAQAFTSAGVQRAYSDVTAISGNAVVVTLGGSTDPNLQANDVLTISAFQ